MNSMKVLVTGMMGRIGSRLPGPLQEAGFLVRGMDLKSGGDILSDSFDEAFKDYYPGAVIHLAGQSDVQESIEDPYEDARQNILGTIKVLEAARDIDAKVVVAASGGTIFDTKSPYGLSKKTAAGYAALYNVLYGLDVVTLALSNVYGPGMGGVVGEFLADWERVDAEGDPVGVTITGDGLQTRDFIYVDDVVKAFVKSLDWESGYYEVGTGVSTSVFEVFRQLTYLWGYTPKMQYGLALLGEAKEVTLRCDLDWTPVPLAEGLRMTLEEHRARHPGWGA